MNFTSLIGTIIAYTLVIYAFICIRSYHSDLLEEDNNDGAIWGARISLIILGIVLCVVLCVGLCGGFFVIIVFIIGCR